MTLETGLSVSPDSGYFNAHFDVLILAWFVQAILKEIDDEFSEEELDGIISDVRFFDS